MKKKIVIRVSMNCDKCRTQALQIAAVASGVTKVELVGEDYKDKLSIEGEDVDAAKLTKSLRKKLCFADLETVEEIKQPAEVTEEKKEEKEEKEEEKEERDECQISIYFHNQPHYEMVPVYDQCPSTSSCTIM